VACSHLATVHHTHLTLSISGGIEWRSFKAWRAYRSRSNIDDGSRERGAYSWGGDDTSLSRRDVISEASMASRAHLTFMHTPFRIHQRSNLACAYTSWDSYDSTTFDSFRTLHPPFVDSRTGPRHNYRMMLASTPYLYTFQRGKSGMTSQSLSSPPAIQTSPFTLLLLCRSPQMRAHSGVKNSKNLLAVVGLPKIRIDNFPAPAMIYRATIDNNSCDESSDRLQRRSDSPNSQIGFRPSHMRAETAETLNSHIPCSVTKCTQTSVPRWTSLVCRVSQKGVPPIVFWKKAPKSRRPK
jgi:hypothetical protein